MLVEGPVAVRVGDEPVALGAVAAEVVEGLLEQSLAQAVSAGLGAHHEQQDARLAVEVEFLAHLLGGAQLVVVGILGGLGVTGVFAALAGRGEQLLGALTGLGAHAPVLLNRVGGGVGAVRDDDADGLAVHDCLHAPGHVGKVGGNLVGGHEAGDAAALAVVEPGALGGAAGEVALALGRIPGVGRQAHDVVEVVSREMLKRDAVAKKPHVSPL